MEQNTHNELYHLSPYACTQTHITTTTTSAEFSSVQDCIYVLRKAHTGSAPSARSFPNLTFVNQMNIGTVSVGLSCPLTKDRWELPKGVTNRKIKSVYKLPEILFLYTSLWVG